MGHATIVGSVRFPGTDSSVLWPPRRTGLARVLMFLRLREREDPRPLELSILSEPDGPRRRRAVLGGDHRELVALELCFRVEALRQCLAGAPRVPLGQHVLWWADSIWSALLGSVAVRDYWTGALEVPQSPSVRRRASEVTIHGCYEVDLDSGTPQLPYRLHVRQEASDIIRRSLAENLLTELRLALPQVLPEWALHGRPRGPRARASFLMPVLRTALFVANELVSRAAGDPRLQRRLADILQDDPQWQKLLAFAETAHEGQLLREVRVVLVDRTLRPAFQAYGVRPLCERGRSADQIYAELLGKQERQVRTDLARHNSATLDQWFDRLLGSEGQTAHDFDLV